MTAAELKVLEARMDMLDAVLQDLIDQVRRTQPSGWTDQRQRAVSGLQGVPVFQSPSQVVADGFEDGAAHKLVGLRESDPPHLG